MLGATLAVALLGIALTARPALAASPSAPQALAVVAAEEEWEEECEEEECEEEAWEEVEGEEDGGWAQVYDEEEALEAPIAPSPQPECPLDTVKPKKAVFERDRGKLRLVLQYTTDNPTKVGVDFWLKGRKDATNKQDSAERRLNRSGVLRLGRRLDPRAQDKTRDQRVVIVQLKAPEAPSNCRSQVTKRLAVGHAANAVSSGRLARVN